MKLHFGAIRSPRVGMSMVEILVVVAVIVILLALLLPALSKVRETSRRTACQANLHNIGIALLQYEAAATCLPAGRDAQHQRDHSWATNLLPYLGHADLFVGYSFNHAWNDPSGQSENARITATTLSVFLCPATTHDHPGATDYAGNYGSSLSGMRPGFGIGRAWDSGVLLAIHAPARRNPRTELINSTMISDGAGQTFAVLEDAGRTAAQKGLWANGQNCLAHEYPTVNENRRQGIYSDHPYGANVLLADGAVVFLTSGTSPYVLGAYSTRSHGEALEGPEVAIR